MIELLLQAERALSVGLLDRAETLYRQVATADPQNSIAVVGLSRVALDRGDDLESLELARRALAIDPENAAAQRMVARLEEVLAYRGDPGPPQRTASGPEPVPAEPVPAATPGEPVPAATPAEPVPAATPAEPVPAATPAEPVPAATPAEPVPAEPVPAEPTPDEHAVPSAEPAAPDSAPPEPIAKPRRRSWIDRLFRRR